ncbi:MAG: amidohydrolase [Rhodospirillales bacterium]|nr:amidohydrolase [Rhodospirillales bacterium]
MNIALRPDAPEQPLPLSRLAIADCDIHPRLPGFKTLYPWLSKRWQEHLEVFGMAHRQPFEKGPAYPKAQPLACRRDAWPPGGTPGSDLGFMATQHLDANNVALGILNPLTPSGEGAQNPALSAAVTHATNEWQVEHWTAKDSRLRASIVVPYEDGPAAAAEIRARAGDPNFAQVLLLTRTAEPLGQRRYWPIYEAAQEAGLPVGIHAFGYGGAPITVGGWPSYYIEEMVGHAQCCQAVLTSLVLEGVFERFPKLKVVLIEAGIAWAPALSWRLDKHFLRLRQELPDLKRLPSEYIRDHVWWTTQPIEEPEPRRHLGEVFDWMGWDRVLFATDYPHWDFDDPAHALPMRMSEAQKRAIFLENARAVYGIAG